jgi:hypothetical protein
VTTIDLKVSTTSVPGITVTGGRVIVQEWPGIHGKTMDVALPRLVAPSWPDLIGVAVPRSFSVGLLLIGTSAPAFYSLLESVRSTVETTATVTLTRVYTNLSGDVTKTAKAIYLGGMDPTMESDAVGRCVPRWQLLAEWA